MKHFYSVAQHSIACAEEAKARGYSARVQLGCLLHDASEACLLYTSFIGYIFSQPLFDNSGQYVVENAKKCYGNIE